MNVATEVAMSLEDLRRRAAELGFELAEPGAAARLAALERVDEAIARLADAGAVSEIVQCAPREAAAGVGLDRVMLSRIDEGMLVAESLHWTGDPAAAAVALARLQSDPVAIAYPLIEGELLRRRLGAVVRRSELEPPGRQANWQVMRWREYVVAPILLGGRAVGFIHGDRWLSGDAVGTADRDALTRFAKGFAGVFERAVLARRLRTQRRELRQVASWADARSIELSDGVIDLGHDRLEAEADDDRRSPPAESRLHELLTPREAEVLEHIVRGEANSEIARSLVVSEGTVKFHVKNILRKMNVSNRAEATSQYLRFSLRGEP